MTRIKLALLAALVGASTAVLADDPQGDAARQRRMDDALQDYRDGGAAHAGSASPGTFERAENAVKRGARKTGHAIEHIVKRAQAHGVAAGMHNFSPAAARRRIAQGYRFVTIGSDARLMALGAQQAVAAMRG